MAVGTVHVYLALSLRCSQALFQHQQYFEKNISSEDATAPSKGNTN